MQRILVLGGTSDAIQLTQKLLTFKQISIIYSLAGLVRQPKLDCTIHSGGFQGNMLAYLQAQQIDLVLDATHPYAVNISQSATKATQQQNIPYWHYNRPAWQATKLDNWSEFAQWQDLYPKLQAYKRPFFAWGREPLQHLEQIAKHQHWLVRTAIHYNISHPQLTLIQAIGGFSLQDEKQLYQRYGFDVVVCKNSGGQAVSSKLQLAQQLQLPILMQQRPVKSVLKYRFDSINAMISALQTHFMTA